MCPERVRGTPDAVPPLPASLRDFPVSNKSSTSGSGLDRWIARFIFAASKAQFDMPTTATSGNAPSPGSSRLCNTFKGLYCDTSARPISSRRTTGRISPLLLCSLYFRAFSNTLSIPSDVEDSEPWWETTYSCGSFLRKGSLASFPLKLLRIICIDKDLLHPGFPTTKTGIRFRIQTSITNTFSRRAPFLAVPSGNSILSR